MYDSWILLHNSDYRLMVHIYFQIKKITQDLHIKHKPDIKNNVNKDIIVKEQDTSTEKLGKLMFQKKGAEKLMLDLVHNILIKKL